MQMPDATYLIASAPVAFDRLSVCVDAGGRRADEIVSLATGCSCG